MGTRYSNNTVSLSAATTDENGTSVDISHTDTVAAYIEVSGSPTTVDVTVQISNDGSTFFEVDARTLTSDLDYYVPLNNVIGQEVRVITGTQTGGSVTATIYGNSFRGLR